MQLQANSHTGMANIPAGSRMMTTISVPIADDNINELAESFTVTLSNPTEGAGIDDGIAKGVINDNDNEIYISAPVSVRGREADGHIAIPIIMSGSTFEEIHFFYSTSSNTATGDGIDFESQSNQRHTIPAFATASMIMIPIAKDGLYEGAETFTVTLTNPSNAELRDSSFANMVEDLDIIVTITDAETLPEISVADVTPSVNETDGTLSIRVNLSNSSSYATSVTYSTADLTATGGNQIGSNIDYVTQSNQKLNIPIGESFAEVLIPINQDSRREGDEEFVVTLSNPSGAVFADISSTIVLTATIIDDEKPILSVVSSTLNVGEKEGTAAIELMLSGPTREIVEVTYSTSIESGDSATQADFTTQTATKIAIVNPITTGIIAIPITDDSMNEFNETFTLTLSEISGAVFSNGSNIVAKVTIIDDEGLPTLSVDSTSVEVTEGSGPAVINLNLSAIPSGDVSVTYSTLGGTAINDGSDYTAQSNSTHEISSGSTTPSMIRIPIVDDNVVEGNEKFAVMLTGVTGATFGANINKIIVTVTIVDNASSMAILSVPYKNVSAFESGHAEIFMRLSKPANSAIMFNYSTTPGSATNVDYTEQNSTQHTFGSGLTDTLMIPITMDDIDEDEEMFTVSLSNLSGAEFGSEGAPTIAVTIQDHDQAMFSIANSSVIESDSGTTEMVFEVNLSQESTRDLSVTWTASSQESDDAIRGTDYAVAMNSHTGIAEIPAGSTSTMIMVPIEGDTIYERNKENTFTVTLSNPTGGAGIAAGTAKGVIKDNDNKPILTAESTVNVNEAAKIVSIPINLSHLTYEEVSANYSLDFQGTASQGSDIPTGLGGQIMIPKLTSSTILTIPIINDEIYEGPETFTIRLNSSENAVFPCGGTNSDNCSRLSSLAITITIIDDEEKPELFVAENTITVNESAGSAVIRTMLSNSFSTNVSVMYSTSNGPATGGADFAVQSNVTHNITGTTGVISIPILNDMDVENDETFRVTLINPRYASFAGGAQSIVVEVIIVDDDGFPRLSFAEESMDVLESAGSVPLTFELSSIPTTPVRIDYVTEPDTAKSGTDYTRVQTFKNVTSRTATIEIPILDNNVKNDNKAFNVRVSTQPNNAIYAYGKTELVAKVTIWDDESIPAFSIFAVGGQSTRSICGARPVDESASLVEHGTKIDNSDLGAKGCQMEGTDVQFRVLASTPPVADIPLNLIVSQMGNFVVNSNQSLNSLTLGRNTVVFRKGQHSETYIVQTKKNLVSDGANGFSRSGVSSADGNITARLDSGSYYSVSSTASTAEVVIWDIDRPRVSIAPVTVSGINEGSPAIFKLTALPLSTGTLNVMVDISQAGYNGVDFLTNSAGSRTVLLTPKTEIENGITRVIEVAGLLSEPTENDITDELNGFIVAKIKSSNEYNINPQPKLASATVTVRDDEAPTGPLTAPIVNIKPASSNSITEGASAGFLIQTQRTDQSKTINILLSSTGGDFIDRSASNIINTTELTTYDEAGNPVVTVVNALSTEVALPANQSSVYFYIQTQGDSVDEPDGSIVATIARGTGYHVGNENVAVVEVLDNDSVPEISITRIGPMAVAEGTTVQFDVSSDRMSHNDKIIYIRISDGSHDFLDPSTQDEVAIPAGSLSAPFLVKTIGDSVPESDGEIQVILQDDIVLPVNYTVSSSNHTAMVTINDNQGGSPIPEISISAGVSPIVEGDTAKFYMETSRTFSTSLQVGITVSQGTGNFLTEKVPPDEITFTPQKDEVILELATDDDSDTESNGIISVTVEVGTGYRVHATNDSASVSVLDNDGANELSKISITADSINSITEGEMANFTISSNTMVTESAGLTLNLLVSDGNSDFISGIPATTATILQNTTSIPYHVSTATDSESEPDGQIVVTVVSDTAPINYVVDPNQNSAAVTVWDDDSTAPISVGVDAINSVMEGDEILFRIQTIGNLPVNETIQVNVEVSQDGDFIEGSFGHSVVDIKNGQSRGDLVINTHDDIIQDSIGSITATLLFGNGYRVDNANQTKSVSVQDDGDSITGIPIVSVEPNSRKPITENQMVPFLITSDIIPSEKLTIGIVVDDGIGDFLALNQNDPIEFPGGKNSYVHNVRLDDDNVHEFNGKVTLTLLADTAVSPTYAVAPSPANQASVIVNDNDDVPEISIIPVSPMVVEGSDIELRIQASRATSLVYDNQATAADPDTSLRVNLTISGQVNEFVKFDRNNDLRAGLPNYVEIPSGETVAILRIPTDDDQFDDLDGRISVSVLPAQFTRNFKAGNNAGDQMGGRISTTTYPVTFYRIDETFPTATVNIIDNDVPILTIASGSPITEGETATFSLRLEPAPTTPLPVFVRLNQTNGSFFELQKNIIQVQISRQGTGTLEIPTVDDNMDELDGQIIAILSPDNVSPPRYQTGSVQPGSLPTGFSASVAVTDNDPDLPRVSISTTTESVVEGTPFVISMQADSTLGTDSSIIVNLDVRDSGLGTGYLNNFTPNPVTLTGTAVTNVTINTHDDLLDEDDGQITVTIKDGTNYTAGVNNTVSVRVTDDDFDLPVVSITTSVNRIVEGNSIDFIVRMIPPPTVGQSQEIMLEVDESVQESNFYNMIVPSQITIDQSGQALGSVLTNDDTKVDASGTITVSVIGVESTYRPAAMPNNSISVEVFDDEMPELSFKNTDFRPNEGISGGIFDVEVELMVATDEIVSFDIVLGDNTAINAIDYSIPSSIKGSIPIGSRTTVIRIPIINDNIHEGNETFNLTLSNLSGATFAGGATTLVEEITIVDNDEIPTLSFSSESFRVIETGNETEIAVELSNPSSSSVLFSYEVIDVTTKRGEDYTVPDNLSGMIQAGSIEDTLTIPIINDTDNEGNETFKVRLNSLTGAKFASGIMLDANVTIIDDEDPVLSFKTREFNPDEEIVGGLFEVVVELSGATDETVTFDITVGGGTATKDVDYSNPSSLNGMIAIGMTETSVVIPIMTDTINEENETFNLTLANLSGAVFANSETTFVQEITIIDDEMPTLAFIGEPFSQIETGTEVEITVELSGPTGFAVSFTYEIIDGTTTAGEDYTVPDDLSGMIQAGSTEDSLTIPVINDTDNEGNEIFTIRLKDLNGAEFTSGTMLDSTVTIMDDEDPELSFKTTDFNPNEEISGGEFEVEVELTGETDTNVTFDIALGGGTAIKTIDYFDPRSLSGMIAVGNTETTITIPITSDMLNEGDETFNLTLSSISGAVFEGGGTSLMQEITIVDDERPILAFTSDTFSVAEDATNINVSVELSGPTDSNVSFTYEIITGSGKGFATANDFTGPSDLSGEIQAGLTGDTLTINIINDNKIEGHESFKVRLKSLTGAVFDSGTMLDTTVTILDDELPELSFKTTEFMPAEEITGGEFEAEIELSRVTTEIVTFDIALGGGTATKDQDYENPSSLKGMIEAGSTITTITIPITSDMLNEGNETFNLTLSSLSGAVFEGGETTLVQEITIVDDEIPVLAFTNESFTVNEAGAEIVVSVELTGSTDSTVSFIYEILDVSTTDEDYSVITSDLSGKIPVGMTEDLLTISINNDNENEGEETFKVRLKSLTGAVFASGNLLDATVTIVDNELPILSFKGEPFSVAETDPSMNVTVELSGATSSDVSFIYELIEGTATEMSDYNVPSDLSGMIQMGMMEDTLSIAIPNDKLNEGNETFSVRLKNLTGAVFASGRILDTIVTIVDDEDPVLAFKTTEFEPSEDILGGEFEVELQLSGPTDENVIFEITLGGGTATKDADYQDPTSLEGNIPIGETKTSILIPITSDILNEGNETFSLTLTSLSAAVFEKGSTILVQEIVIVDDEIPTLAFSRERYSVVEDGTNLEVSVELSGITDSNVSYIYEIIDQTTSVGIDYESAKSRRGEIIAGSITESIIIPIINDQDNEENETFIVRLSDLSGAVFASGSTLNAIVTILDNDEPLISFKSTDFSPSEKIGSNSFKVELELAVETDVDVTFDILLGGGTAIKGNDYKEPTSLKGKIPIGSTITAITIPIANDNLNEGNETFNLSILNLVGAEFEDDVDTLVQKITIIDDENPTLDFAETNLEVNENVSSGEIDVVLNLSGPVFIPVELKYQIESGSAVAGFDFTGIENTSGSTLIIAAGRTMSSIRIPILNDSIEEMDEEFKVRVFELSNAVFENNANELEVTITIKDDDLPVLSFVNTRLVVAENVVSEKVDIRFNLSKPTVLPTEFIYETENVSAQSGADFVGVSLGTPHLIEKGETAGEILISIKDDDEKEGDEEFRFKITSATNLLLVGGVGELVMTITITDDESLPQITIAAGNTPVEEGNPVTFTLSTNNEISEEQSIEIEFEMKQEGEYLLWRVSSRFTMIKNEQLLKFETHDDQVIERQGKVIVTLIDTDDYTSPSEFNTAEVIVNDNDEDDLDTANRTDSVTRLSIAQSVVNAILIDLPSRVNSESNHQADSLNNRPIVSVQAENSIVNEGNPAVFYLTSSASSESSIVVVSLNVESIGNFFDFKDSQQISVQLSGQDSVPIVFQTIDDSAAEADGSITISINADSTYKILMSENTASVTVSDLADRQKRVEDISLASQDFLPDMTGVIAARTLGIATDRISNAFLRSNASSIFMYDGKQNLTDFLTAGGEALNDDSMTVHKILGNSSFTIDLFRETEGTSMATIWGIGDYRDMDLENGLKSRSWDADVFTGHLGLDAMVSQGLLVGITAAVTESDIDHTGATEGELTFKSRTTALNPYFGWTSADKDAELRAVAGYGVGEIDIEQTNYELQTVSNTYHTLGISGNQTHLSPRIVFLEGGTSELSITGQSWFARQNLFGVEGFINSMQTDASHYRIGIVGSHSQSLVSGSTLKPTFSVGLRGDSKDNQSIFGMEVGSELSYTSTFGLSLTGNGNMFLIEQGEIQKWSLLGAVSYDYGKDKLGTILEISPSYGQMENSNSRSLWSSDILESVSETGQYMDGTKVDTELSYGLSILDDTSKLTPFGGIGYSDDANNKYHIGTRLQLGSDLKFELTGTQETDREGTLNQKIKLDGAFNW